MNGSHAPSTDTQVERRSLIDIFPQYFLALTGIIYAAGFLVILSFLDRFGLLESGADFLRTRYIHIGILCVALPLIVNGTILSLVYLIRHGRLDQPLMWQRLIPIGILVINLEIVCFILVMLTRRDPHTAAIVGLVPLQWILALTLVGLPIILAIERMLEKFLGRIPDASAKEQSTPHTLTVSLRWILVVAVAGFDCWFFLEFYNSMSGTKPWLGLSYIGLSLILGLLISTVSVYERRQQTPERRRAVLVLSSTLVAPFFYLIVLAFAYGVFPNIPSTRGGGDYSEAPKVLVTVRDPLAPSQKTQRFMAAGSQNVTMPLIVIEETSWAFYLADPTEAGGPAEWKDIGGRKPEIFALNKTAITSIHAESRVPQKATP
jgi:hypothetical protein